MRASIVVALLCLAPLCRAEPDRTVEARQLFQRGAELVKQAQWAEALSAFSRSAELRPHPVTTYNRAACERALGRYTRAVELYTAALADHSGERLPDVLRTEAEGLLHELGRLLVHLDVELEPPEAAIAIDGRPLQRSATRDDPALVAGIADFGPGRAPPKGRFAVVLDPGSHLFTVSRAGYADVPVHKTYAPGVHDTLALQLERLPARLRIAADHERAVVTVDDVDVGAAPIDVARPPGSYTVVVRRPGYAPYKSLVALTPGQAVDLAVHLEPVRQSVVRKWWFWTALGVGVTAVALGVYFGARAAETPQIDGGGLQWAVKLR